MTSLTLALFQNAAVLLALIVFYDLVSLKTEPYQPHSLRAVGVGFIVGILAVVLMTFSALLEPGIIFDLRSVLMGITGLFFGPVATGIAVGIGATYRLVLSGSGAWTGAAVIVACGGMGLAWKGLRRGSLEQIGFMELLAFGVAVQAVFLALMLTLPDGRGPFVLSQIAGPVFLIFPVTSAAVGALLAERLRRVSVHRRLAESEARYRSFFHDNHAVILLVDPENGRIVNANAAAANFYGYSLEQLRSKSITEINTLSKEQVKEAMGQARTASEIFQFRHKLADGSVRNVEIYSGPILVDGQWLLYSIVHDITLRVEAEERLREKISALKLRDAALEAAANPIVITAPDGTVEWVNEAFTTLTGYTRSEALGQNPRDLVRSGVHTHEFYEAMWQTILSGSVWQGNLTNQKKDGTIYQEYQTITPIREETGKISHFIAVKMDLSPRIEMEARLAEAQKVETLGRLAGGIAHDFNNILTVINGTIDLVLTQLPADVAFGEELQEIRDAGDRGARLTRQLLAFSRRQILNAETVALSESIEKTLPMLRRLLGEHIDIEVQYGEKEALVHADRSQLDQIITNLALNGRDAMVHGGTLTISTDVVNLEMGDERLRQRRAPGPYVQLRVQDTGTGMTPDTLNQIFEPFFTTKAVGKGTGLGLSTVYGIVTQSGGEVVVESVVGEGSTFDVLLPLSRGSKPAESLPNQADPTAHGVQREPVAQATGTILLVEDEPAILRFLRRVLDGAGYSVVSTTTSSEALELARNAEKGFDLLFTDVIMPGMSGPQLAQAIRTIQPDIRVIFASGYMEDDLRDKGVSMSHTDFLSKPYTAEEVTQAVSKALGT